MSDVEFGGGFASSDDGDVELHDASPHLDAAASDIEVAGGVASDSNDDVDSNSNDDVEIGGGALSSDEEDRPWKRQRARQRAQVEESGTFWALLVDEAADEDERCVFGLAELRWQLVRPSSNLHTQGQYGSVTYTADAGKVYLFEDPPSVPSAWIASPTGVVRALEACGPCGVNVGELPMTLTGLLAMKPLLCEGFCFCSPDQASKFRSAPE